MSHVNVHGWPSWGYSSNGGGSHTRVAGIARYVPAFDCATPDKCLQILVDTSSSKLIHFNLQLFPMYDQDPINLPYVVDITPCRVSTFAVPVNPGDIVLDRTSDQQSQHYQLTPTYHNLFANSHSSECPILGFKMMEQDGTAFPEGGVSADQLVSMVAPHIPSQATFTIQTTTAFQRTFRIEAYTMSQKASMDISLRVCGGETISLVNTTMKEHVLPFAQGATASISFADRYFIIHLSEFAGYFDLTPNGDPCVVKDYKIYSKDATGTLVEWSGDNQIKLEGRMPTAADPSNPYYVRIDKTVVTGAKVFYIGAITRGLTMVAQPLDITVCPNQGGATVTPPVPALSHMVQRGSTGAAANAPFTAWKVMDIY
jgi:hypothetical protein